MSYKYPEIKEYIIKNIDDNKFQEGEMLPPEREFTSLFNVSRMTVRRALDELINDGILIRKKGSGVVVALKKETRSQDKVSFKKDKSLISKYGFIETKVIELKTIKEHPVADRIFKDYRGDIYHLKRIQCGNGKPIVFENIFFKKDYFKNIHSIDCSQSMSDILNDISTVNINNEEIIIDAKNASKEIAYILQIPVETSILQITSIQKHDDDVIYFGIDCLNGDEFNYSIHNKF